MSGDLRERLAQAYRARHSGAIDFDTLAASRTDAALAVVADWLRTEAERQEHEYRAARAGRTRPRDELHRRGPTAPCRLPHHHDRGGDVTGELLTNEEREFVRDMGQMWGRLGKIVGDGPTRTADLREAIVHVHALQQMVMSQAAGRAYPDEFRLLGQTTALDIPGSQT